MFSYGSVPAFASVAVCFCIGIENNRQSTVGACRADFFARSGRLVVCGCLPQRSACCGLAVENLEFSLNAITAR